MRANLAIRRTRLGTLDIDVYRRRIVRRHAAVGLRRGQRLRLLAALIAALLDGKRSQGRALRGRALRSMRRRPLALPTY